MKPAEEVLDRLRPSIARWPSPRVRVVFSPEPAERDLEAIGDWIANDNPERAATFVAELRQDL